MQKKNFNHPKLTKKKIHQQQILMMKKMKKLTIILIETNLNLNQNLKIDYKILQTKNNNRGLLHPKERLKINNKVNKICNNKKGQQGKLMLERLLFLKKLLLQNNNRIFKTKKKQHQNLLIIKEIESHKSKQNNKKYKE